MKCQGSRSSWEWGIAFALLLSLPVAGHAQGRAVTLIADNRNVREVLTTLAAAAGVQLVIAPEIRGLITIRIENRPFEEALSTIATLYNLEWKREDGVYRIGPRQEEEKAREVVVHLQYAVAEEVARAFGYVDLRTLEEPYPSPWVRLLPAGMKQPPQPKQDNSLVLRGSPAAVRAMQRLLLQIDLPTPQLSLQATLVQVPAAEARNLRLRWQENSSQVYRAEGAPRALPFAVRSGDDWLKPLLGSPQATIIAQRRLVSMERRPALLGVGQAGEQAAALPAGFRWPSQLLGPGFLLGWVGVVQEEGKLQTWIRFAFAASPDMPPPKSDSPAALETWTVVVDGYLVPPEETMVIWLSATVAPSSPSSVPETFPTSARVYLLVLSPRMVEAAEASRP